MVSWKVGFDYKDIKSNWMKYFGLEYDCVYVLLRSHWSIIYSLLKNYCCLKGFQSNYFQIGTKLYLKSINVNSKIHWFSGHRNKQDKQGRIILFFTFLARINFLKKLMLEKYGKASISWTHKKGEICTGQSWNEGRFIRRFVITEKASRPSPSWKELLPLSHVRHY